jgi:hypothetical protein
VGLRRVTVGASTSVTRDRGRDTTTGVKRWRPNDADERRAERDEPWSSDARAPLSRAISDDDLLRFFSACETDGMLG